MSQLVMLRPVAERDDPPALQGFREAQDTDAPALADLLDAAFTDHDWDTARVRRDLLDADDVTHTFVLDDTGSGRLVATASCREGVPEFPGMGYVHWVGVSPDQRAGGLGRAATARVIEEFATVGRRPVVLTTDDWRLPAIATYLGLGFIPEYRDDDHPARWSAVFVALRAARRAGGR